MGKESGAEHVCECLLGPGVGGLTEHQVAKSLIFSPSIVSEDDDAKLLQTQISNVQNSIFIHNDDHKSKT